MSSTDADVAGSHAITSAMRLAVVSACAAVGKFDSALAGIDHLPSHLQTGTARFCVSSVCERGVCVQLCFLALVVLWLVVSRCSSVSTVAVPEPAVVVPVIQLLATNGRLQSIHNVLHRVHSRQRKPVKGSCACCLT